MAQEDKNIREVSLVLLGACTISGLGLPGTLSLPVLISRAFRRQQSVRLRIESENHIDTMGTLLKRLEAGDFQKPYDIVLIQSMIGKATIPQLRVGARLDRPGVLGRLYRWARRIDDTPTGHRWMNFLRAHLGRQRSPLKHYDQALERCLHLLRSASPGVKIVVLGPGPTMSKVRAVFTPIYEQNLRHLRELAAKHDFDFIDLHPKLITHEVGEIYQADGLHYTAAGQRIVAQAIIGWIHAKGLVNANVDIVPQVRPD